MKNYPPGPVNIPIVGNLFQIPKTKPWVVYAQWARKYGDIVHFRVFSRHFVVLNTMVSALDLFERRSSNYSDRPVFVMGGELVGRDSSVLFTRYGDRLRAYRRILNSTLGPSVAHKHSTMQQLEVHKFLNRLVHSSDELIPAIRRFAGSVALFVAYGHVVEGDGDKYVLLAEELSQITAAATQPGKWLVDYFPYLKHLPRWMPGSGFLTWATNARKRSDELIFSPLLEVKRNILSGTALPSLTADYLQNFPENEDIIAHVASSFYLAGADTTASILATFFLMMTLHPDVQSRAVLEIETIVGTSRLPCITDRGSLPFVDAVIKEVYRFHPVVPLIIHSPLEDDIYRGFLIPKGSSVLVNVWGILHDESVFPHPDHFDPDRYMDNRVDVIDPRQFIFGLGRRICPGMHLGEASVFMAISNALATLRISKAADAEGKIIEPAVDFTNGLTSHPLPFPCKIEARTQKAAQLLEEATIDAL
ncbi:cytochrome P450 [Mycena rebaudengoi]|nr:cytochrome P450 [Mycena rebaudengoi]